VRSKQVGGPGGISGRKDSAEPLNIGRAEAIKHLKIVARADRVGRNGCPSGEVGGSQGAPSPPPEITERVVCATAPVPPSELFEMKVQFVRLR
jgi:hypothetical protein